MPFSPHFGPRLNFLGPTGTKPCLQPKLDQICFGGHSLAFYNIDVPCFEIGDEICYFLGTKSAMFGPQNLGTAFPRFLAIFIRFWRNLVCWSVLIISQCWATQITRFLPFRPHFGPQIEFLGTKGDETLFMARFGPNLVWWTLFGIE